MSILVSGGAGYIGSHMTYALCDEAEHAVVLDDLSTGLHELVDERATFVRGDVGDKSLVTGLFKEYDFDCVIHFAGSVVVPESVQLPLRYYSNNTLVTLKLIEACTEFGVKNFIFSSTAAVYGVPDQQQVTEETPLEPISPYGRSKLMIEWILEDTAKISDFRYIALRYFNVAGADPAGRTGQSTPNATHLIKRACQVALGRASHLDVFGTDYPTPDGTAVRDYIHVSDLIAAHEQALRALPRGAPSAVLNCGYGHGFSVREVLRSVERVAGHKFTTCEAPRRAGDPAMLISHPSRLKTSLGWMPTYDDLDLIVASALAWESRSA